MGSATVANEEGEEDDDAESKEPCAMPMGEQAHSQAHEAHEKDDDDTRSDKLHAGSIPGWGGWRQADRCAPGSRAGRRSQQGSLIARLKVGCCKAQGRTLTFRKLIMEVVLIVVALAAQLNAFLGIDGTSVGSSPNSSTQVAVDPVGTGRLGEGAFER